MIVRAIQPEEFSIVASWLSRPDINRWLFSEWRGRQCDEHVVAIMLSSKKNRAWCAISEAGMPVGLIVLSEIDQHDRTASIWYVRGEPVAPGIMTEAVREVATLAFNELRVSTLLASVMEPNTGSRQLLEKIGFKHVGRIRNGFQLDNEPVDRLVYDLLPSDLGPRA